MAEQPEQPEHPEQRHLVLILARAFASRLATGVLLNDAEGRIIHFNEAAEDLLGTKFIEGHGMTLEESRERLRPSDDEGNLIPFLETPLGIAVGRKEPAHSPLVIRGIDGVERRLEVTAFPLFAHAGEFVGAITFFWERE
jgi:PAS domain-containing protein